MNQERAHSTEDMHEPPYWPTISVPLGVQLHGPDFDADAKMLVGLGAVIRAASMADHSLRMLYCALVGSPYATVTAAGQMTNWLLDGCLALTRARFGITEEQRLTLIHQLDLLKVLAQRRNRFVHDVWAGSDDGPELMRSKRGSYGLFFQPVALDDLIATSQQFNHFSVFVTGWIFDTLGGDAAGLEAQFALGRRAGMLGAAERTNQKRTTGLIAG